MSPTDAGAQVLEVVGGDGRGLRVTFIWDRDRYEHEIAYLEGSAAIVCLRSEPGRDQDPWPASPALQQLSLEELEPGRPGAFLVGMSGQSHWSQSVEADAATASLTFDVACRALRQPRWLGSSYGEMSRAWGGAAPDGRSARGSRVEFHVQPAAGSPPSRIEIGGGNLVIAPDLRTLTFPSTVRWKYRIALCAAAGSPRGAVV